jgi:hypothetical protein
VSWARLLKRVLALDIEHCPHCAGTLKIIAAIEDPALILAILTQLNLPKTGKGPCLPFLARPTAIARWGFAVIPSGRAGRFRPLTTSCIACARGARITRGPDAPRNAEHGA